MRQTKKRGRPKGSPIKKSVFISKVYDFIPENGAHRRHKELMEHFVKSGEMAYQSMQDALNRLLTNGSIVRERVESKRGAGTGYRRIIPYREDGVGKPYDVKSLSEILKNRNNQALSEEHKEQRAKKGLGNVYGAFIIILTTIVFPEMIEYARNTDKEQAKKRLMAVFQDRVSPMLMQIAEDGINPAMIGEFKEQTKIAFENLLDYGYLKIDKMWQSAKNELQIRSLAPD